MFSKFFIDRPIFATVLALLIVVAGLVTLGILPIAQYPDITPPTVQVSAVYPGANAQTVAQTVGIPIEQQVNGVDGMLYMSSNSSSSGAYSLTITFAVGTDIDMATVQVQNRVSVAQSSLPTPVVVQGVTVQKQSSNIVMFLTMTSDSKDYDGLYLSNYAKLNLVDQLTRVPGVGAVNVMGAGDYSMRIWLDPAAMRIRYLSPADVYQAIQSQNVEVSAGNVGQPIGTDNKNAYQYSLTVKGRLTSPEEFGNIILRTETGGKILRLRDVAHIDLGSASYSVVSQLDGKPTAAIAIYQQPGSNSLDVSKGVKAKIQELSQNFPAGIQYNVTLDTTDVIHASIDEVMVTFLETTLLVVLVIFLFLQNWRAVVIPCITIPVSLIGTLAVMSLFGFSINTLTLFGLILAVAIVVDDAIVVVEGVHAKLDQGYTSARKASIDAMRELGSAIVSITLVMMAVFIPVSFMSGTSGVFYRQFGLTMAIAIGFSALNALTLSPALCAILLKPHKAHGEEEESLKQRMGTAYKAAGRTMYQRYAESIGRILHPSITLILVVISILGLIFGGFNFDSHPVITVILSIVAILAFIGLTTKKFQNSFEASFDKILKSYKKKVLIFIQRPWLSLGFVAGSIAVLVWMMNITPTAMVPSEDTGTIMGVVTMPPGTSQDRTEAYLNKVDSLVRSCPAVEISTIVSGYSFIGGQGPSYGSFIIKLKDWEERSMKESSTVIFANLYLRSRDVFKDAQVLFFQPPMISGYGVTNGFTFNLQDRTGGDLNKFYQVAQTFLADLQKRPEIESAQTTFNTNFPQYTIDIDAAKCKRAGLSPRDILTTLQGYYGGLYASNFNRFGKIYRVMIQGEQADRANLESLYKIKVRNGSEMAPITEFMTVTPTYGPDNINRFNMYTSMSVNGNPATGYTSGQAIKAIEEVAEKSLPTGYSFEFSGQTREEQQNSGSSTGIVFVLCFVFIYLLLAAQYESYMLPFAVLLSVPFGLAGSFLFIQGVGAINNVLPIFGEAANNIYVQIALIMLMGLLAKNAILIVEFALERRKMGMSISWAAVLGAGARLRPILMTSLAMIIGLLPLMFSFGVGANANRSLGTSAIGGMLIGMLFQIFIVPSLFVIFEYLQEKIKPITWEDMDNSEASSDIEQYTK